MKWEIEIPTAKVFNELNPNNHVTPNQELHVEINESFTLYAFIALFVPEKNTHHP